MVLALAALASASTAAGQDVGAEEESPEESPRIERLVFRGVESVSESDLRSSIETEETRCRSPLLGPLCSLTSWSVLLEEHHLDREELSADELRLRMYYHTRGYRGARVFAEVVGSGEAVEVVFDVTEGPATRIVELTLRQSREVLSARRIRRADLPAEGDPLDLLRLGEGLQDLASAYGERGYLDAELRDSVAVSPDGLRAQVAITLRAGARATLDTVEVRGNERVSDDAIVEALLFRRGRVLRTDDIAASQRSLYESNLFHIARVRVPEQPDSTKRVRVTVREAPPRSARVSGGFNSVEFGQLEGRFTHYDWLGRSRRIDLRAAVGNLLSTQLNGSFGFRDVLPDGPGVVDGDAFLRPTWEVSAEFRQPTFISASNVLGLALFAHRRTIPAIAIDEGYGADVSVTRRLDFPTSLTLDYRFEMTGVHAGELYFCVNYGICSPVVIDGLRTRHRLSPLAIGYVDDQADDPVAPKSGYRLRADAELASTFTLSDFGYTRLSVAGTYYRPLDLHRTRILAGRVRGGWARPLEATAAALGVEGGADILHPRKRFYAGGSRSVRGYHENQLGPRVLTVDPNALRAAGCTDAGIESGTCDPSAVPLDEFQPRPVGGSAVLEANLEYRFPIWGFQGAVFLDGALVGDGARNLFESGGRALTPGFGGRWATPVGPVRVDLGIRPLLREELPVVTEHVDERGLRRIVRLETPLDYDPLEESANILDQVLGRLVLHLSIGEAF